MAGGEAATGKLPPPSDKQGVTFAADIKPIFDQSCIKCHGSAKAKGRLRLHSLEAALKGGEEGSIIQPGDSARSPLVRIVARIGKQPAEHRRKVTPLTEAQVGLIRAWIDQGAK